MRPATLGPPGGTGYGAPLGPPMGATGPPAFRSPAAIPSFRSPAGPALGAPVRTSFGPPMPLTAPGNSAAPPAFPSFMGPLTGATGPPAFRPPTAIPTFRPPAGPPAGAPARASFGPPTPLAGNSAGPVRPTFLGPSPMQQSPQPQQLPPGQPQQFRSPGPLGPPSMGQLGQPMQQLPVMQRPPMQQQSVYQNGGMMTAAPPRGPGAPPSMGQLGQSMQQPPMMQAPPMLMQQPVYQNTGMTAAPPRGPGAPPSMGQVGQPMQQPPMIQQPTMQPPLMQPPPMQQHPVYQNGGMTTAAPPRGPGAPPSMGQTSQIGQPIQQQPSYQNGGIAAMFDGGRSFTGVEPVDLLQNRHILPPKPLAVPRPRLQADTWNKANCSQDIFRCTLTKIPETDAVLKKSRLPLGVLIHPFKDLSHLPVIQCTTIVRCRQCRTYINPFVHFVDQKRWRCNICYRVNELPEEFLYDPVSKSYGDPSRRPECKSSTIEFIAPTEYMLRPPQPAVYIFCLDVSYQALENGYLKVFCDALIDELDKLPGDGRTQVGFITYDRSVHFYSMPEGASQPTQLNVSDIDDMFLPSPSDLLVNLNECRSLVEGLLTELPNMFSEASRSTQSALGAALQAAYKMAAPTGGRISIFQTTLPNVGPGAVSARETVAAAGDKNDSTLLGPATDFYKKLALDCSGQQIAVDLFTLSSQFIDLATLSGISKFSGGQVQHFAGYHHTINTLQAAKFEGALRRYLTRKIGFEAVLRIRCTRGLTPHTFHGNFFVRSTDLLSLPNINPDAGFAMQVSIEDDLRDSREVSFQAALLYTSSKGERRIRVHTFCLPTTTSVQDVINGADQQAIVGMLAKFASERAINDSTTDAKEGLVVSCTDTIETYKSYSSIGSPSGLLISQSLKLMPLYTLACMRASGFRNGQKLDDKTFCFSQFKTLPLSYLMQYIYPDLYRVDELTDEGGLEEDEDVMIPQPPRLQLSYERVSATGMYLLDAGDFFMIYVCRGLHQFVLEKIFGVTRLQDVDETMTDLPELENPESERLRVFLHWLNGSKPYAAPIKIIREDGKSRQYFTDKLIEDRMDNSFSYFEFLQHLKQQIK